MSDGPLRYDEAVETIAPSLVDLPAVLVGGQALNYWVDRYRDKVPELEAEWPFTSEDIDFFGTRQVAETIGKRLGGRIAPIPPFDPSQTAACCTSPCRRALKPSG